jgi:hypothetical protein
MAKTFKVVKRLPRVRRGAQGLPSLPRLPSFATGKRMPSFPALQPIGLGRVRGSVLDSQPGVPPVPEWWAARYPVGSDLEWMVYWWLTSKGIPFDYQVPFGGGRVTGGQMFDFLVKDRVPPLVLGPQGEYWHYASQEKRQHTMDLKLEAQRAGFPVVFMREQDLRMSLESTMTAALAGIQLFAD